LFFLGVVSKWFKNEKAVLRFKELMAGYSFSFFAKDKKRNSLKQALGDKEHR